MKICVVGAGYVGLVSAAIFADWGHDVVCVDNDRAKVERIQTGDLPVYELGLPEMVVRNKQADRLRFTSDLANGIADRDLVMIAVGTPAGDDGHPNLTALWNVVKSLKEHARKDLTVAVKSTVPVGTCSAISQFMNHGSVRFDIVSAPEFLRQGTAISDFLSPDRMIVGCKSEIAKQQMKTLLEPLECPVIYTDWQSSEMIKYASNTFLALKISYINTIANLCEEVGANIHQVALGIGLDHRIGPSFLKPGVGFGGSCLPKDTQAIVALGETHDVNVSLFRQVLEVNEGQRARIVQKLLDRLDDLTGKKIAVLGLAFKPNTNDVREAPSLSIIPRIVQLGGTVVAYDPVVEHGPLHAHYKFTAASEVYEALNGADAAVILTEWEEFYGLDLARVRSIMKNPLLVDGRNLFAPHVMKEHGFHYIPVGISDTLLKEAVTPTV